MRAFNSSRVHQLSPEELAVFRQLDPVKIPQHVAIIMDGNGRWAGKRALKRFLGHQQGAESVQFVVETASRIDLPWLTLYAFSLENNLRRPKSEVNFLMKLLKSYLVGNVKRMNENNVRMNYIGRIAELPTEVQETMQWASEATAKNVTYSGGLYPLRLRRVVINSAAQHNRCCSTICGGSESTTSTVDTYSAS